MITPTLSESTVGQLVLAAGERAYASLDAMLLRAGLGPEQYGYHGGDLEDRVQDRLLRARRRALENDREAHRSLITFVCTFLQQTVPDPYNTPSWFAELRELLLADGYQLTWDNWTESDSRWANYHKRPIYRLLPTDSGPVPLAGEISALERDLDVRGYAHTIERYRDAVENFTYHKYPDANGALRTALEALVMGLAKDHANFQGRGRAGEGRPAIDHLIKTEALPKQDGGNMLLGLWEMIQTNGPHPGQSTADEARMRIQFVTATARFLLNHFESE